MKTNQIIKCNDGHSISVTQYESSRPLGIVIIASALGIKQSFYSRIALHLAENSYNVVTFDYRSTGDSRIDKLDRNVDLQLSDWGRQDLEAVIQFLVQKKLPIHFIGHSIGGQILGLSKSSNKLKKIIFIASSAPYWKRWNFPLNLKMLLISKILFPLVSKFTHEFPAKMLGLGNQNIPSCFIKQWAIWMSKPDYLFNEKNNLTTSHYSNITQKIISFGFTDDKLAPLQNIKYLHRFYSNSTPVIKSIHPKEINVSKIGHVGFFHDRFKDNLWKDLISILDK